MFLRCSTRKKNGKEHRYWSVVENRRVADGRVLQRHVLYLGEISGGQQEAWQKSIEIFEDGQPHPRTVALLPEQAFGVAVEPAVQEPEAPRVIRVRLAEMELRRPPRRRCTGQAEAGEWASRQWGACWLACHLYQQLGLDGFFAERLPPSRKGTRWDLVLQTLCAYRLIDPGSEWRLHRRLAHPPTPAIPFLLLGGCPADQIRVGLSLRSARCGEWRGALCAPARRESGLGPKLPWKTSWRAIPG